MILDIIALVIIVIIIVRVAKKGKGKSVSSLPGDTTTSTVVTGPERPGLSGYAPKPGPVTEAAKSMKKSDNLGPKPPVIKPAYVFYKYEPNVMGKWMCLYCDAENVDGNVGCVVCGNSRPN